MAPLTPLDTPPSEEQKSTRARALLLLLEGGEGDCEVIDYLAEMGYGECHEICSVDSEVLSISEDGFRPNCLISSNSDLTLGQT